jgi:hypothetical protein
MTLSLSIKELTMLLLFWSMLNLILICQDMPPRAECAGCCMKIVSRAGTRELQLFMAEHSCENVPLFLGFTVNNL